MEKCTNAWIDKWMDGHLHGKVEVLMVKWTEYLALSLCLQNQASTTINISPYEEPSVTTQCNARQGLENKRDKVANQAVATPAAQLCLSSEQPNWAKTKAIFRLSRAGGYQAGKAEVPPTG